MSTSSAEKLSRRYRKRYILALVLIGVFVFIELFMVKLTISEQEATYTVVNISGRQRMLSQRINALASNIANANSQEEQDIAKALLREAINLFSTSHEALIEGNNSLQLAPLENPEIEAIYFADSQLDQRAEEYLDLARLVLSQQNSVERQETSREINLRSDGLLFDLDRVVDAHERAGASIVEKFSVTMIIIFALTVILLFLIGRFIFEPMSRLLIKAINKQASIADKLATQRDKLQLTTIALEESKNIAEEARNKAEQLAEAKGRFLAMMSHELRTPLTAIIGFGDLLRMKIRTAETAVDLDRSTLKDYSKNIIDSGRHLLSIVNDVLDFASFDEGKMQANLEVFNLKSCFYNIQSITMTQCRESNVSLVLKLDDSLPDYISSDEQRLNQIMFNLVGNAIKFSRDSEVIVTAHAEPSANRKVTIRITVSDSGPGIPKDMLGIIFDPFEQVKSGYKRQFGGSGLGLAITKEIVTLLDGKIWVESEEGKGTQMHFYIIAEDVSEILKAAQVTQSPRADDKTALISGIRILVIDDIAVNIETVKAILEQEGVTVATANSGTEALVQIQKSQFDFIMLDLHMPGMDGEETARKIRAIFADDEKTCPPIYAWSADVLHDFESNRHTLWDGVIQKPVFPNDLIAKISGAVS